LCREEREIPAKGEETGKYDVVDAATTKYYLILENENAGLR
jgi:hypothetical protein